MSVPFALKKNDREQSSVFEIAAKDVANLLGFLQNKQLPEVLHVEDVEKILRISHYTCLELIKKQEFPSFKIGRFHKVPRDEFFRWLAESSRNKMMVTIT